MQWFNKVLLRILDNLRQDLRYAVRSYLRTPGTTLALILTLALGIGANTAVFSVVNAVLLKPLPYPGPSRIVVFETTGQAGSPFAASPAKLNVWRQQTRLLEQVAGYQYTPLNLTGIDHPERVQAAQVSANYFSLFGLKTIRGRLFTEEEDRSTVAPTAVISEGLWKRSLRTPGRTSLF